MGTSSGSNIHHQPSTKMLPPRQQPRPGGLQTSLSLVSSDPHLSPDAQELRSNSDNIRESPSESASSRETWPTADAVMAKKMENGKTENDCPVQSVIHRVSSADKISLRDIARERVDIISEKMHHLPDEFLEELKNGLRVILEGTGGSQHREEFSILQRSVQVRSDLTAKTLIRAHRVQLEILVAINTGIQAFLHPSISLSQTSLIEVFVFKRCRNIACQNQLPAADCTCEICSNRKGFCNLCMCVICNKFDFEVNTCRWIGCDLCSHWTHTDCAIRDGQISMGPSVKSGSGPAEMLFRCRAYSPKSLENGEGGRLIAPQEACNRIAEVVQEATRKMELVADEKMRMFKKARMALEACDRELEEKAKEVTELKLDRQKKKIQIEELERIVRLKQAEADMFQLKANEAREAERLQRIALAKTDKSEEEYASSYLKLRLSEAEAEKQYLFEKIKLQESSHASQSSGGVDASQVLTYSKIHDLLDGYNGPPKSELQPNERHHFRTNP
ncbi:hypothetical protein GH714_021806 [Hevea brasiliensis]|uniref:Zinc finger PHD-type domain-containing protein n=1 Tax=Hevea brasiliensis TaxID=3981 RepID=A0A6A6KWK3_HEVBR|nr:hypothetical protein GH714_021806 [Hevea brasiliensis]